MDFSELNVLLATLKVAQANVQGRHWLTEGENFKSNHELFGAIYDTLGDASDIVAESIRVVGGKPVHLITSYPELSAIRAGEVDVTSYVQMLATRNELAGIVKMINEMTPKYDVILQNDLTGIGSRLRHWLLFLNGQVSYT